MSKPWTPLEFVNYSLRPNKNIERKLIVELLLAMARQFPIREYRYVGFGGLWYVDFVLFHKALLISDMVSIERADPERAEFNRPFSCVTVRGGNASDVIREVGLDEKPALLWLDYEDSVNGPGFQDAAYAAETAADGSVLLVTINSNQDVLRRMVKHSDGQIRSLEEALRSCAPHLVPTPLDSRILSSQSSFEGLVGDMLLTSMIDAARQAGREETFRPLLNFAYRDGAPMVTAGGVLLGPDNRKRLQKCQLDRLPWLCQPGSSQYRIAAPLLTAKEKGTLDRLLPAAGKLTDADLFERTSLKLKQSFIDEYAKVYRHYPQFAELFR